MEIPASEQTASSTPVAIESGSHTGLGGIPWSVWGIAAASFAAHMLTSDRYGYFRDVLYYMACARHLALGYVDQPPMIALVTWFTMHTLGTSLPALMLFPALAGAAMIVLTGVIARDLGGGRFAQGLAAFSIAVGGAYVVIAHQLAMNVFEPLLWMGCADLLIRIIKRGDQKLWIWFGVLSGLGLENKYSMAVFGFAVVVGLLLTEHRRAFCERWIYLGGAIAFAIFLPNLLWNVQHHFPFVQLMHNINTSGKNVTMGPLAYLGEQAAMMGVFNVLIWFPGLLFLFFSPMGKRFRALGWAFLVVIATFMILKGKDYYSAPAYPMLLAAGAVALERIKRARRLVRIGLVALLGTGTALGLPILLPILSLPNYMRYQHALGYKPPATEKSFAASPLPQYYSDELGWREMVANVAQAYNSLPRAQRQVTAIFAQNYGEAGAIDFFGPKYGLPPAISGHQNYYYWGPRQYTGQSMIVLGADRACLEKFFQHVTLVGHFGVPLALERGSIWWCTGPRGWTLRQVWPTLKNWH